MKLYDLCRKMSLTKTYIVCIARISLWPLQIVLLGDNLLDINNFQYSFVVM